MQIPTLALLLLPLAAAAAFPESEGGLSAQATRGPGLCLLLGCDCPIPTPCKLCERVIATSTISCLQPTVTRTSTATKNLIRYPTMTTTRMTTKTQVSYSAITYTAVVYETETVTVTVTGTGTVVKMAPTTKTMSLSKK